MNDETINLAKKKCLPCEGGVDPIDITKATNMMGQLDAGWELQDEGKKIFKEFKAKNHYEITSIINLIIWISHKEDHHPEITFGYNTARVTYFTYAINGLSENDFICAAKIDQALKL